MKRLLTFLAMTCAAATSFSATLNPVQLLSPAGSSAGQTIVSTGASTAPGWATVPLSGLSSLAANTVVANATGSTAAPTAFAMPSCSTTSSALQYTSGTGITCFNGSAPLNSPTFTGTVTAANITASGTLTGFAGRLLNVQIFSVGGTYTPTTGTAKVIVRVQAPGGGSGGVAATAAGQSASASGGGAGSYAEALVTSGFSGVTVTAGATGTGATAGANNGVAGGTTSFGSIVSCPGGAAGNGGAAVTAAGPTGASGSVAACTISGATTLASIAGNGSGPGMIMTAGSMSVGGLGGSSPMGIGGQNRAGSGTGLAGTGYGAGAGGANNLASASAAAGTNGQPAIVIVYEFSN